MSNLPTASPVDMIRISPESLDIANCYLALQSVTGVSEELGVPTDVITATLAKSEVRAYIDSVFLDLGWNNQYRLSALMDSLIDKKLQEMEEADVGSGKDILEILQAKHKMAMETMAMQIKLEQAKLSGPRNQVNVQINDGGNGGYQDLLKNLMKNARP